MKQPVTPEAAWREARRIQNERPGMEHSPATVIAILFGVGFWITLGIIVANYLL
jgi:hypothetical protein